MSSTCHGSVNRTTVLAKGIANMGWIAAKSDCALAETSAAEPLTPLVDELVFLST